MRVVLGAWLAILTACAVPAPPPVREVRVRSDRRLLRENRALRREVRALRDELAQARSVATSEAESRRRESEALGVQIQALSRSIELLERSVRVVPAAAPTSARGRRDGTFGKLRVGIVPAESPTPPEPRDRMDAPQQPNLRPDLLDPFTKAAAPGALP